MSELRDTSQAAALEVEKFRAENGLTAARGELMSDQQLSDLNSQLILAQADTANALARYTQYKSIIDSGPENAVEECDDPVRQGATAPSSTTSRPATSASASASRRSRRVSARTIRRPLRCAASRPTSTRQIFQELQQLTESYRNEYEVAKSREASLRGNVGELTGRNSRSGQSMVRLRELEQKSEALATLYQTFLARYEEASQQRSFPIAQARVISQADNPVAASSPRKTHGARPVAGAGPVRPAPVSAPCRNSASAISARPTTCASLNINFLGYLPLAGARPAEGKAKAATQARNPRATCRAAIR